MSCWEYSSERWTSLVAHFKKNMSMTKTLWKMIFFSNNVAVLESRTEWPILCTTGNEN